VTDVAGNVSTLLTVTSFTIDLTLPVLAEITPVTTPTNVTTPSYTFSSTEGGTVTYGGSCSSTTTTVVAGNNTIVFNALTDGTYSDCTIIVTDPAGNPSIALTVTPFTIQPGGPVLAQVTPVPTPSSDTTPSYTFSSTAEGAITYGGACSSTTTTAVAGNNSITFGVLGAGTYSNCTIQLVDLAGNSSGVLTVNTFVIDLTPPVLAEVTPVSTPTNDTTPNYTFSATEGGAITYTGGCSSSTTTAVVGSNPITFSVLVSGTYSSCTITVTDPAGNPSAPLAVTEFIVNTIAPVLTQIAPIPSQTNDTTPSYTFNSTAPGNITYGGPCSSTTSSAVAGDNLIVFRDLAGGTYTTCTITLTDPAGNVSNELAVTTFTVESLGGGGFPIPVLPPPVTPPPSPTPSPSPTPTPPPSSINYSVRLVAPNGGETLVAGETVPISWSSSEVTDVRLLLSADKGLTYTVLIGTMPASPSVYQWDVAPFAPLASAKIRIEGLDDDGVVVASDESDAFFDLTTKKEIRDKPTPEEEKEESKPEEKKEVERPAEKPACGVVDCTAFSYEVVLLNPNGTARSMNSSYAQVVTRPDGWTQINFEDSGQDFDFNDVVVLYRPTGCGQVSVRVASVRGTWHHRVQVRGYYGAVPVGEQVVVNDTHKLSEALVKFDAQSLVMCKPAGPQVTLYDEVGFKGKSQSFTTDVPDLRAEPFGTDKAKSIKVSGGAQPILYENAQYKGRNETFGADDSDLANNRIGSGTASSLRIGGQSCSIDLAISLLPGAKSSTVGTLQRSLVCRGLLKTGEFVPNVLDPVTERAVRRFQIENDLSVIGAIDEETADALANKIVKKPEVPKETKKEKEKEEVVAPGDEPKADEKKVETDQAKTEKPEPAKTACGTLDCTAFSYDLALINPDGTVRSMNSRYARVLTRRDGWTQVGFEDSGRDFDFNDVIVLYRPTACGQVTVRVAAVRGTWHHKVVARGYYGTTPIGEQVVVSDTHGESLQGIVNFKPSEALICRSASVARAR